MNDQLDKVNAGASFIEAFITHHPIVFGWFVAMICSWVMTAVAKQWFEAGPKRARNLRALDVAIAAAVAALMMWGHVVWQVLIGVSLTIGGLSPFGYFAFSEALCWWKPGLRKYLSLRELAVDDTPPTGDDTRVPPGDIQ